MSIRRIQFIFSLVFIICYFILLTIILVTEISDDFNMNSSENSMMDELNILLGILTASLGQILNFWFNNAKDKEGTNSSI